MNGPENMALDELLLARATRTGETVFRVYSWAAPTLSFGRNQRAQGVYDAARLSQRGVTTVRRPTGGRALLHHREVTYSVTAPIGGRSLRSTFHEINSLLCDGLGRLGVMASIAVAGPRTSAPTSRPCFDAPSAGELMAAGRKLVGSAQWRTENSLLQHGSILLEDDQSDLPALASVPLGSVPPPATLTDLLGRTPELTEVADALFAAVDHYAGASAPLHETGFSNGTLEAVANRYRDESWTWRR